MKRFSTSQSASVKEAAKETGATVSVIYVPPVGTRCRHREAVEADLDLAICITEGIPVRDMAGSAQTRCAARKPLAARRLG